MDRQQAIQTAKVLRKGMTTYNVGTAEFIEHKSISLAKKHSRSLGRGVALQKHESLPLQPEPSAT